MPRLSQYEAYDEERQVTKPTSCCRAAAHVPNFDTLVPAPELSLVDAKNNPIRNMTSQLYRERQLWSRNERVKIRYVSGSFVAGTSASSPGVPRSNALFKYFSNLQSEP